MALKTDFALQVGSIFRPKALLENQLVFRTKVVRACERRIHYDYIDGIERDSPPPIPPMVKLPFVTYCARSLGCPSRNISSVGLWKALASSCVIEGILFPGFNSVESQTATRT